MKFIASLAGSVALCAPGEQTSPPNGILQRDLISYITNLYSFSGAPVLPNQPMPQIPHLPVLQFQSGACMIDGEKIPIGQILKAGDGDLVSAQNTVLASKIMADYMLRLEEDLNFRFSATEMKTLFHSALVVQFDDAFVNKIDFCSMAKVINETCSSPGEYSIKKLHLGKNASNYTSAEPSIRQFISDDFVIERRANEPFERNMFFCSAPLTTEAHLAVLEKLEIAAH